MESIFLFKYMIVNKNIEMLVEYDSQGDCQDGLLVPSTHAGNNVKFSRACRAASFIRARLFSSAFMGETHREKTYRYWNSLCI